MGWCGDPQPRAGVPAPAPPAAPASAAAPRFLAETGGAGRGAAQPGEGGRDGGAEREAWEAVDVSCSRENNNNNK